MSVGSIDVDPALQRVRRSIREVLAWGRGVLAGTERLDLVIVMSLVLTLGHSPGHLQPLVVALAVLGLIRLPTARRGGFWLAMAALRTVGQIPGGWFEIDNHQYLLTYWCLALGIALLLRERCDVLRVNARLLVGLAFAFATVWKLTSPDFLDGSFFHYTLLVDDRFAAVTRTLGGAGAAVSGANADLVAALTAPGADPGSSVVLDSGPRVTAIAQVLAWGTVVIEGAVAVAFLAPARWISGWVRDAVLLPFIWLTYTLAPVVGFGWLLAAMGLAQSRDGAHLARSAYVGTFILIPALPLVAGLGLMAVEVLLLAGGIAALTVHMFRDVPAIRSIGAVVVCAGAGRILERYGELSGTTLAGIAIGVVVASLLAAAARVGRHRDGRGRGDRGVDSALGPGRLARHRADTTSTEQHDANDG